MICNERGVISPSQYFFFSPSENFLKHNYGVVNCGHFFCRFGYQKERQGNAWPLFLYVKSGEFHLDYEDGHYTARSEEIILINCSRPHRYYVDSACEFYYFHFAGKDAFETAEDLIHSQQSPLFRVSQPSVIYHAMHRLISRLFYDQTVSDVDLSCMAYQCLCILHARSDVFVIESEQDVGLVNRIAIYVRENIGHSFTLKELADHVSLSPCYFAHLFKQESGITPIEYVAVTKINYARNILKTSAASVSEIADLLGYSSTASFINAFKKRVGMPPERFRRAPL